MRTRTLWTGLFSILRFTERKPTIEPPLVPVSQKPTNRDGTNISLHIPMQILSDGNSERIISTSELRSHLDAFIERYRGINRLLIIPPDITRLNSRAGEITAYLYQQLKDDCYIRIMPALGTHFPMTVEECHKMFGTDIPMSAYLPHHWKDDLEILGELPSEYIAELSEGKLDYAMEIGVNKELIAGNYDLIVSVGQIVPHEVIGMANYTKNVLIGVGGGQTIHKSHFLGAVYGMERIMGETDSPVRAALNEGYDQFLRDKVNLQFILTVIGKEAEDLVMRGLYIGDDQETYAEACELSRAVNINHLSKPIKKCIVYLDPEEFKSTWIGGKSVYRTRMAIEDGGELIILAPALETFGEDPEIDRLIRKYGYKGTTHTLEAVKNNAELRESLSAAAHLIHATSDGRFSVTYCPGDKMSRSEIEAVGYGYAPYQETADQYQLSSLKDGWNTVNGEEIFYVSNPALGLWKADLGK